MFAVGEKVVYPGHGVAQISRIFEKKIGDSNASFYELTFCNKEATILVPTNNAEAVGLRALSSTDIISDIFKILAEPAKKAASHDFASSNWNKRHKEYQLKMRTGSLWELSKIYRDLRFIETQKELSFGEKNLLQKTEALLVEEISLVQKLEHSKALEQLRQLCAAHHQRRSSSSAL